MQGLEPVADGPGRRSCGGGKMRRIEIKTGTVKTALRVRDADGTPQRIAPKDKTRCRAVPTSCFALYGVGRPRPRLIQCG